MRFLSTIIALLLALVSLAAMWRFGGADLGGLRAVGEGPRRLLSSSDLPIDQVERITLKRGDDQAMTFERESGGAEWKQTQPFAFPMDPFSIRQMAVAARELEVVDRIAPDALGADQSLTTLQLSPPAAEITYQWPGGSLTLELGRRSVAGRAYLRRKGDDQVCIVNQNLHERVLDMNPWEWRDRTIFHLAGADSDRIETTQGEARMTLERNSGGGGGRKWMMTAPVRSRVDPVNLDAYLQALGKANVADFILDVKDDKDLANFGLASPVAKLEVTTSGRGSPARPASGGGAGRATPENAPITERLLIGSRTGSVSEDRFGMIEGYPVIVRLSAPVLAALIRRPVDLAAPTGSGVNPADVKSIVIRAAAADTAAPGGSGGAEELRLERDLERWRAPDHSNAEVNAAQVQELLDQLCKLRAPSVEFRDYPRELEIAIITLHGFDGKALDTVRIAQERDKSATALENGDNVLRVFPQGLKMRLRAADFGL
jgi:hypothetical protein